MSMQPAAWPEPDPLVASAIAAKYRGKRPRPLAVQIRDQLGQWLDDEEFASVFGIRGRPGWSPSRLALVTVLQRAEKLTDRAAADAVRNHLDWQYLLGLPLDDPGFDDSVLAEFRAKVAEGGLEQVVLDRLLERLAAGGLIKAAGKQRTDSTHVEAFSELRNDHGVCGGGRLPEVCRAAVITRLVLRSRPVRTSRRLTGMPSARVAARRRIRPSLPSLNYRLCW
jgi:transposase